MYKLTDYIWEQARDLYMGYYNQGNDLTIKDIMERFKPQKMDKKTAEYLLFALENKSVLHDSFEIGLRESNYKSTISALRNDNKQLKKELDEKGVALRRHNYLLNMEGDVSKPYVVSKKRGLLDKVLKKGNEAVAYIIYSDLHYEEWVTKEETDGDNEYTPEIATKRSHTMVTNGLKLVEKERLSSKIETLVFAILGDVITGRIHDELIEGNSLGMASADGQVTDLLIDLVYRLAKEGKFKKIIVPCVRGNHGRNTKRKYFGKGAFENSRETKIYMALKKAISNYAAFKELDCEIEVVINVSDITYIKVYDKTIRLAHGDNFRYNGGNAGISGPMNKWLSNQNDRRKAHMTFIGHWHQVHLGNTHNSMINGSIIGTNPYSLNFEGERRPPQQIFCIQDSWRGFTMRTQLDVLDDQELLEFYKDV